MTEVTTGTTADEVVDEEARIGGVAVTHVRPANPVPGPAILMVHGGCHGRWCWEPMQRWFAGQGWPTTALDWYSHGESDPIEDSAWLARDVMAVREEIGVVCRALIEETGQHPIIMGHSMGGLAGLAYAALEDARIPAVVLLAPVVPSGYAEAPIDVGVDLNAAWGPPPLEMARALFFSGVSDEEARAHYQRLRPESPAAVWQATRWTAQVPMNQLDAPMLIFGAENDLLVPADAVRALAVAAGATYVQLPGTGHGLTLDPVAAEVCTVADAWLSMRLLETAEPKPA